MGHFWIWNLKLTNYHNDRDEPYKDTNHVARNDYHSLYAAEYSTVFNSEGVRQLLFEDAGVGRRKVLKRKSFEAESCMHVLHQRCRVKESMNVCRH